MVFNIYCLLITALAERYYDVVIIGFST